MDSCFQPLTIFTKRSWIDVLHGATSRFKEKAAQKLVSLGIGFKGRYRVLSALIEL